MPSPSRCGRRSSSSRRAVELPRFWIVMQILIVIFVLAGMVIAITKLA
jgi:hypothetical protein